MPFAGPVALVSGVAVLVNSRGSGPELLAMLEDVDPAVVLADSERTAAIRGQLEEL